MLWDVTGTDDPVFSWEYAGSTYRLTNVGGLMRLEQELRGGAWSQPLLRRVGSEHRPPLRQARVGVDLEHPKRGVRAGRATVGSIRSHRHKSSASSRAVAYRFPASFCIALRQIASKSRGRFGTTVRGAGGSFVRIEIDRRARGC